MNEMVHFVDEAVLQEKIAAAIAAHSKVIRKIVPCKVNIHHVGSTAVPGALTKGDLDLLVLVKPNDFPAAEAAIAAHYSRNEESDRSSVFASFKRDDADPPLGIQLTCDDELAQAFLLFLERIRQAPALLKEYNELKQECEGLSVERYRQRKTEFIERVLAGDPSANR
jgi:GrpB-like predicted nucleotidyltransferase (UPF0157 family)